MPGELGVRVVGEELWVAGRPALTREVIGAADRLGLLGDLERYWGHADLHWAGASSGDLWVWKVTNSRLAREFVAALGLKQFLQ
jgi:hypothetical protein